MRYYDISITADQASTTPLSFKTRNGTVTARWQSHPGGVFNPQAPDVEFQLYVAPAAAPIGGSFVRIWGVDLALLVNAIVFSGNTNSKTPSPPAWINIQGGMLAGLPLNDPTQAGLLSAGIVWQSFGNWRGTEMTLDLMLNSGGASLSRPANIILNWQKGQTLQGALESCILTAFPGATLSIAISQNLIAPATQVHRASTLTGLAQLVSSLTQQMQGIGSLGVQIVAQKGVISVFDGTSPPKAKQINFTDLIGQPTWQAQNELWIQTVLRGDIFLGDAILMPKELSRLGPYVLTEPQSLPAFRQQSAIQGQFFVKAARHVGRFRASDGAQWSSTYVCGPLLNLG